MNKKIFVLGLSMAFVFSIGNNVYANNTSIESQQEENRTYVYEVIKVGEKSITLLYQGEIKDDSMIMVEIDKE